MTTLSSKLLFHQPLENRIAIEIVRNMEELGYHVNAFIGDRLYMREDNTFARYYRSIADIDQNYVGPLADYLEERGEPPTKLTVIDREARLEEAAQLIRGRYGERVVALRSRSMFLEVTDRRSTKGQALRLVAGQKGIDRREIVAIGDSYNDLDMIKYAGLGVAVANACPALREASDLVTASNVEDGVAEVIEKYIL